MDEVERLMLKARNGLGGTFDNMIRAQSAYFYRNRYTILHENVTYIRRHNGYYIQIAVKRAYILLGERRLFPTIAMDGSD